MSILHKTFGGLTKAYYFRQFFFGAIFSGLAIWLLIKAPAKNPAFGEINYTMVAFCIINALLYPYARFVYDSVTDFLLGKNIFIVNALFLLIIKFITMFLCWGFAIFIAPIGLIYLYFYHTNQEKIQ